MAPTSAASEKPAPPTEAPPGPPEEKFWKRYSKHHELPLSSLTSIGLHALVIGAVVALGIWGARLGFGEGDKPVDIVSLLEEGGGGGSPEGSPNANPEDKATHGAEVAPQTPRPETAPPRPAEQRPELKVPTPAAQPKIEFKEKANDAERQIQELEKSSKEVEELLKSLGPSGGTPAPAGRGGPGSGGGKGSGHGARTGPGSGNGPGGGRTGTLSERARRALRWNMNFRMVNGPEEHLQQLSSLGAILGFPVSNGQYYIVRDLLSRPARGQVEEVNKINRIFWVDRSPHVGPELVRALRLPIPPPPYIVAFFPEKLEEEMRKMEFAYRRKAESEITEQFNFDVLPDRAGGYQVVPSREQR